MRKIIQTLALLLLLVVLPLGSWYYLRTGLNYRLEAMEELKDYGKVGEFRMPTSKADTISSADLSGRLSVVGFIDPDNDDLAPVFGDHLNRLHQQFDDRPDVLFLQYMIVEEGSEKIDAFEERYQLTDQAQCFFLMDATPEQARRLYRLPPEDMDVSEGLPYFVLVDTAATVRRYYDVRNPDEVRRLVEHIALILPAEPEKDLVFKREIEK